MNYKWLSQINVFVDRYTYELMLFFALILTLILTYYFVKIYVISIIKWTKKQEAKKV